MQDPPKITKPMRRFGFTSVILLVAVALYTGWWFSLAIHAEEHFKKWQTELAGQKAFTSARLSVRGYPFAVTLHARDFSYEKPGVLKITTPNLMIRLRPWTPFRPVALSRDTTRFEFIKAGYAIKAEGFEMGFVKPWFGPNSSKDTGLVVRAHFTALHLDEKKPMALGNLVQEVGFTAKVKGNPPDPFKAESLTAWRENMGMVDIQWLKMRWGPLSFDGAGTLTIDKTFQPQAAFNGKVAGYNKAIDALLEAKQIQPFIANLFKAALKLLEDQKKKVGEEPTVTIPTTIQSNALAVAGVVLARWEPFPWP
jgi:hypothetical protein